MNTNTVNMNEMEMANGGNFFPNKYTDIEYASCGIKVVNHTILSDEFWWQGENLSFINADKVMKFTIENGRQPYSLEEAKDYYWKNHQDIDF